MRRTGRRDDDHRAARRGRDCGPFVCGHGGEPLLYAGYGIGAAATTLVGRNIGAGKHAEAKRCGNICTAMGGVFMGVTGAVMMLICPLVFRMLTPDAEVRTLAAQVLRIGLLAEPLYGVSIVAAALCAARAIRWCQV